MLVLITSCRGGVSFLRRVKLEEAQKYFLSLKETSNKLVQTENQPEQSEAEKNLKEADEKFKLAEAEAKSRLIDQQKSLQDTSAQLA